MCAKKTSPTTRSRMVRWEDPMIIVKAIPTMNGLDFLRAIKDGQIPTPPIASLIGFRFTEVEAGRVVLEIDPAEYHYNPTAVVHGGVTCAVLDSAATCAVHSTLPAGMAPTTLEIKINYLRPIRRETGVMRCEGGLIYKGNRTVVAEAKMFDSTGLLHAYAVSTCLIFETAKDGARAEE